MKNDLEISRSKKNTKTESDSQQELNKFEPLLVLHNQIKSIKNPAAQIQPNNSLDHGVKTKEEYESLLKALGFDDIDSLKEELKNIRERIQKLEDKEPLNKEKLVLLHGSY